MIETPQAQVPAQTDPSAEQQAASAPARFDTLPLDAKLLRAVADQGYAFMTPIQAKAIPLVLEGRDVMGAAQTGTGKTAAFSIPLLQKMMRHETASVSPARHPVRALVLAPTRELADQVANNIKAYAKHSNLRVAVVFGGIDMKPQTLELKGGVEVLIATPGRLLDHIEAKNCVLNQVEYVVLDEADRMLDIGFLPDLQRILSYLPKTRQTLLFSATFSPEIKRLAGSYLQDPLTVEVARANATATNVEQRFYSVTDDDKRNVVRQILKDRGITQALVFVNSKLGAARLARTFERDGMRTSALHGDMSQDERLKALASFKKGEVDVLVCTDVAARGPRHRRSAGRLQLRRAVQRRGLRPPHRPHRPCRRVRPGGDARHARRRAQRERHREAHQQEDRARAVRGRGRSPAPPGAAAPHERRRAAPRCAGLRGRRARAVAPARARAAQEPRSVLRPSVRGQQHVGRRARMGKGRARRPRGSRRAVGQHPLQAQGCRTAGWRYQGLSLLGRRHPRVRFAARRAFPGHPYR